MPSTPTPEPSRPRQLQLLGILSGFTAGAWLGAAEAPTKLVSIGLSPIVISLVMVVGVFLARWSVPALILGTSSVRADVRRAPHLIIWAVLGGCLWAVANTMTIFAIRDVGLSIAFPLWNSNSLLAIASSSAAPAAHSMRGVWAALGAGVLWGTMYIPYRKAYLTGMNPLSFITFFSFGELGMMTVLSVSSLGFAPLWQELLSARSVIFWLMPGGFVWVIGDVFQQYAAKYVGISRGIPLSNSNQLWGLLWGILVFGELHGRSASIYLEVIGGSLHRMLGVGVLAFSSAIGKEQMRWKDAAQRESQRYGVSADYVEARMDGGQAAGELKPSRSALDWFVVAVATGIFAVFATMARAPRLSFHWGPAAVLSAATLALLLVCGLNLWRTTRFH